MKSIKVTPLKEVNGVKFGQTRTTVRTTFGSYTEFKKTKKSSNTSDDFKYCHVFYNDDGRMEAVELFLDECKIDASGKKISKENTLKEIQKALGIDGKTDEERSIGITEKDGKVTAILFGGKDYYGKSKKSNDKPCDGKKCDDKKEEKKDEKKPSIKKESADDIPLTKFYQDLKAGDPIQTVGMNVGGPGAGMRHPGAMAWRRKALGKANELKDNCCRHLIVDIYCHMLPLDQDYIQGNMGMMKQDVDSMLKGKNMDAVQYLTSSQEKTRAPLLEYVLRSVGEIAKSYMEEADAELKDAQEQNMPAQEPPSISPEENENVASQLVDVKSDTEYQTFVDALKEKTIKKIVTDVSKIINDKKETSEMTFNTSKPGEVQESSTSIALDYIQKQCIMESVEPDALGQDEIMGMAIRESALNELNAIFRQDGTNEREFKSRIRLGRGFVISEAACKDTAKKLKCCKEEAEDDLPDKVDVKEPRVKKPATDSRHQGFADFKKAE